jgi:hypothetical protein
MKKTRIRGPRLQATLIFWWKACAVSGSATALIGFLQEKPPYPVELTFEILLTDSIAGYAFTFLVGSGGVVI